MAAMRIEMISQCLLHAVPLRPIPVGPSSMTWHQRHCWVSKPHMAHILGYKDVQYCRPLGITKRGSGISRLVAAGRTSATTALKWIKGTHLVHHGWNRNSIHYLRGSYYRIESRQHASDLQLHHMLDGVPTTPSPTTISQHHNNASHDNNNKHTTLFSKARQQSQRQ